MGRDCRRAMQDDRPVLEIVIGDDGQPVFQICGLGMCTRHRQFAECQTLWEALLVAKGLHPDQHPVVMPPAMTPMAASDLGL